MRTDPHPEKGRALGRLEAKQGRSIEKGRRADGPLGTGGASAIDGDEPPEPRTIPLGGG